RPRVDDRLPLARTERTEFRAASFEEVELHARHAEVIIGEDVDDRIAARTGGGEPAQPWRAADLPERYVHRDGVAALRGDGDRALERAFAGAGQASSVDT